MEAESKLFATRAAWTKWLEAHHADSTGLWLRIAKQGSTTRSVSYAEALEVALCYGWIDGQRRRLDDECFIQRFTPRGPRSIWSKINREKVLLLIEGGKMKPAGLAAVEAAKRDGRWDAAYESVSKATVPEDLQAVLDREPKTRAFFESLTSQNRYAILFRLHTAKKPETRAKRLEQYIDMLRNQQTLHPQKR